MRKRRRNAAAWQFSEQDRPRWNPNKLVTQFRRWAIASIAAVCATAEADQAPAVHIGQSFKEVVVVAGAQNLSPGGPDSKNFRHYELSGPLAIRLSGKQDSTAYLVFQLAPDRSTEWLVYASWKLVADHEAVLLRQFGIVSDIQRGTDNTICAKVSAIAMLAIADSSTGWSRQAVLEAVKSPEKVRPTFSDLCAPRHSGAAR